MKRHTLMTSWSAILLATLCLITLSSSTAFAQGDPEPDDPPPPPEDPPPAVFVALSQAAFEVPKLGDSSSDAVTEAITIAQQNPPMDGPSPAMAIIDLNPAEPTQQSDDTPPTADKPMMRERESIRTEFLHHMAVLQLHMLC